MNVTSEGYAEWLVERDWGLWCTWTFPVPNVKAGLLGGDSKSLGWNRVGVQRAVRSYQRIWQMWLWTQVIPKTSYSVLAVESHRSGAKHLHSLIGWPNPGENYAYVYLLQLMWAEFGGGFSRVQNYNGTEGVFGYCAKYAIKDDCLYFVGQWG